MDIDQTEDGDELVIVKGMLEDEGDDDGEEEKDEIRKARIGGLLSASASASAAARADSGTSGHGEGAAE